jgi:hypothetical protein
MSVLNGNFKTIIARDFFCLFVGKKIGEGVTRVVYEHRQDPTLVIKIEPRDDLFLNVMEWRTWYYVEPVKAIARWFAPCVAISPCGRILLQRQAEDIPLSRKLPDRMPDVFGDLKRRNFGLINGRLVCRDYGTNCAIANGIGTKTRKADWSPDDES